MEVTEEEIDHRISLENHSGILQFRVKDWRDHLTLEEISNEHT